MWRKRVIFADIIDKRMKYYEVKCTLQPFDETATDLLSAMLSEIGFEAFSVAEDGLLAYIQQSEWSEAGMQEVIQNFCLPDVSISYTCSEAPDEDWNQVWEEEGFQPIILSLSPALSQGEGDISQPSCHSFTPPLEGTGEALIVVHDVKHTDVPAAKYDILITPRLAFGTGSHQTTRLILRTLAHMDLEGKHVIDAGTGTGILSIMCIKRGAADVFAYDIDEWSVENTKDNLLLNHIYNNVEVKVGNSSVLEGQPRADLLIANINRNTLLADLPRFASVVKKGGRMILSGFYLADVPVLTEAASRQGFSMKKQENEEEWAMLLFEADALGGRDV